MFLITSLIVFQIVGSTIYRDDLNNRGLSYVQKLPEIIGGTVKSLPLTQYYTDGNKLGKCQFLSIFLIK